MAYPSDLREISLKGIVDTNNSTATVLTAGSTFTGTATEIIHYGIIFVNVTSDQVSAADGLVIEQSSDGTNWDHSDSYMISAGSAKNFSINPYARYMRIKYTNGAVDQTYFRLQTILKGNSKPNSHRIKDNISDEDDAELVKAILTGEGSDGIFRNVNVSASNRINTVSQPYTFAVAEGDILNHTALLKFGTRTSVSANTESLIWEGTNDLYTYLSTATQLDVVSSSTQDGVGGTGIRTLKIVGLDNNLTELEETITMNGTTTVTTTNSFKRVFRAYGVTSGTSYTNVGNINIVDTGGANQLLYIPASDGQTLMTMWTVPLGKTLYITQGTFSTDSNKGAVVSLFTRQLDGGILYPWQIKYRAYIFSGNEMFPFHLPFKIPEKTDVEIRVTTPNGAGTTSCGGTFEGWYEVN